MLSDAELASCRSVQAEAMPDACTLRRPGQATTGTFDPTTGKRAGGTARPAYYTGACRVLADAATGREAVVAAQEITTHVYAVVVPWTADAVEVDDLLEVTSSRDPRLVDRVLTVVDVQASSYATARRLLCTDDQG